MCVTARRRLGRRLSSLMMASAAMPSVSAIAAAVADVAVAVSASTAFAGTAVRSMWPNLHDKKIR